MELDANTKRIVDALFHALGSWAGGGLGLAAGAGPAGVATSSLGSILGGAGANVLSNKLFPLGQMASPEGAASGPGGQTMAPLLSLLLGTPKQPPSMGAELRNEFSARTAPILNELYRLFLDPSPGARPKGQ